MIDWAVKVAQMAKEHREFQETIDKLRRFLNVDVRYWTDDRECQERLERMLQETKPVVPPPRKVEKMNL